MINWHKTIIEMLYDEFLFGLLQGDIYIFLCLNLAAEINIYFLAWEAIAWWRCGLCWDLKQLELIYPFADGWPGCM